MNWTMARLLLMTRHASDAISIQQVTVAEVTANHPANHPASHVGFLKGITREYYSRTLQSLPLPAQNSSIACLTPSRRV